MARSAFVEVSITNSTKLAQDSQDTADNAVKGVTDLNDPNLMSVIEKQTEASQYAGLTSQYNVVLARAKEANISTTALTTAYTSLNTFMTAILTDTTKASDVNRDTYKGLTDAYNSALSNVQTALSNSFNTDISNMQSSVSVASQAASSAVIVASQAAVTGNNASQSASQAVVVASQAKSAGDNANSVANSASQAASNAILAGSQASVSASQASADYQKLSAGVNDGSIVHITTETVIDKGVIGTAEIANAAITNAQIGKEAVGMAQIANLAVGTAQIGDGAITNAKIGKLAVGTAQIEDAAITDAKVGNISANHLTAGTIDFNTITGKNINASNITTGTLSTDRLNVDKLSALSANLGDVTTGSLKGVDIVANTFSTPNGSFTTDSNGAVVASNLTIRGVTNLVYNASLLGGSGSYIPGWDMNNGYCSNQVLHDGVQSIGYHNSTGAGIWKKFAQSKLYPLNGKTGLPYSASVWFLEVGSDTSLQYAFTLAFFDSNGNRIESAKAVQVWNGIGSYQDWRYVTINNAVSPSNAEYVGIQYSAYNGHGYGLFSSPMLTQTAQSTGYQPDTGNVVSAGEIDGSTINGSTINGTTFHGGDIINDANNTSKLYPTTISSDGHIYTTRFSPIDAMQTDLSTGSLTTKYRANNATSSNNQYEAYDTTLQPNQIVLLAGHTNGKDMSFSQSVTGSNQDGYVLISPLDGITIHGDTQQIHFNGTSTDVTPKGIAFTPYGNINATGTQGTWYIGNNSNMLTASFGIDNQNNNHIGFYRPLFVDEIGAISSSNGGALFLHGQNNSTGQILLKKDSTGPQVLSASIYNRTYSGGSTVTVTGVGTLGRITSASKYKLAIAREPQVESADRLLTIDPSSWVDLEAAKAVARNKSNGEALLEHEQSLNRYHGLIAEDLRDAGLDEFVIYGKNGEIEGIQYDRLWTVLIPKIKQLNERLNELERKSI